MILIDCGCNNGVVLRKLLKQYPQITEAHAFEPNLQWGADRKEQIDNVDVTFYSSAVWSEDTEVQFVFYPKSQKQHASSIVPEKYSFAKDPLELKKVGGERAERMVKAIRFSSWIQNALPPTERLIVKMDIEGAEYAVLSDLLNTDIPSRIEVLLVEFHGYKMSPSPKYDYREIEKRTLQVFGTKFRRWS